MHIDIFQCTGKGKSDFRLSITRDIWPDVQLGFEKRNQNILLLKNANMQLCKVIYYKGQNMSARKFERCTVFFAIC